MARIGVHHEGESLPSRDSLSTFARLSAQSPENVGRPVRRQINPSSRAGIEGICPVFFHVAIVLVSEQIEIFYLKDEGVLGFLSQGERSFMQNSVSSSRLSRGKPEEAFMFPHLQTPPGHFRKKCLKIGIVTPEIVGPSHGGVGTAYDALATALSKDGNSVTILFVPPEKPFPERFLKWKKSYSEKNIQLDLFPYEMLGSNRSLWWNARKSHCVMRWLNEYSGFDVLHFPIDHGLGYYTILAKHQGSAFLNTSMVVGAHSSTFWDAVYSYGDKTYFQDFFERNFLEKECCRLTDFLVSPSQYFLRFLEVDQNFILSEGAYVQPNIMLSRFDHLNSGEDFQKSQLREFVFFGRLEKRKGLVLLCDALDHPEIRNRTDITISFLGHSTFIDGKSAAEYLKDRSKRWSFSWKIIPRMERDEALKYLKSPGRIALIPSLSETMSYTVLECLWAGIPFLASSVGGIPELINSEDLDRVTFSPNPKSLSLKIAQVLQDGIRPARTSFDISENEKRWVDWHQNIALSRPIREKSGSPRPKVSLCLTCDCSEGSVGQEQLHIPKDQDYPDYEVVVVFTGTMGIEKNDIERLIPPESNRNKRLILMEESRDPVYARNLAAKSSSGDYLIFLDPEIELVPGAISHFVSVSEQTGADVLTAAHKVSLEGEKTGTSEMIKFYLGNCFSLGLLHNVFGEKGLFIRKTVWEQAGGFPEKVYGRDYLFEFLKALSAQGARMETIPFPLFLLKNEGKRSESSEKFLYPHIYTKNLPQEFHEFLYFIQASRFFHDPSPDGSFTPGFVNRPQAFVDQYWGSRPWKIYTSMANRILGYFKASQYQYPHVNSLTEALRAVEDVQQSFFWNLIMPFLKLRRILRNGKLPR